MKGISDYKIMKKIISLITAAAVSCGIGLTSAYAEGEIILNSSFEDGTAGFNMRGTASVDMSSDTAHSGESSLLVGDRGGDAWNGASRGISGIKLDDTYRAMAYVKAAEPGESFEVKLTLELTDYNGTDYPQIATAMVNSESWTLIEGTWKANYTGNLSVLNLNLETSDNGIGKSFYVDDIFFAESSAKQPQLAEPPAQPKKITYSGIELASDVIGTPYERSIEMMQTLGVMDGYPDGTFRPEAPVTRAEFVTMLLRFMNAGSMQSPTTEFSDVPPSHFANGYIGYAVSRGICEGYGDGIFGPDDTVTYAQAVKMLMSVMGYGMVAEQSGGYPDGYLGAAAKERVGADGFAGDAVLNRGAVTELFVSAIEVPLYKRDANDKIYRDTNSDILSEYFDAVYERGYVTSNNKSSVSGGIAAVDSVTIDGEQYRAGTTRAGELVGYSVRYIAAYPDAGDDPILLFVEVNDSKVDEMEISSKDIVDYDNYTYEYDVEGKGRTKTVRLNPQFTLIYNGKTVNSGFTDSLMKPLVGSVKLISSNSSDYDTVIVTSYDICVADYINRGLKTVYGKDKKSVELNYDDYDISFVDTSGKEQSFSSITEGSVLHIARSLDGEDVRVIIGSQKAEGEVRRTSEDYITIDDTEYEVSEYFNANFDIPALGKDVTAYLDINGQIVYMDRSGASGMSAGYVMRGYTDDSGEDYYLRVFTEKGDFVDYKLDRNIKIDGTTYAAQAALEHMSDMIADNPQDADAGMAKFAKARRRIILYSANSDNSITRIDTAYDTSDGDGTLRAALELTKDEKFSYKQSTGMFYNDSSNHYFSLSTDALIFSIPEDESDTSDYEIKSVSSFGWSDYEMYPFKADPESLLVDYGVEFATKSADMGTDGYVITAVRDGLNSDGEEVKVLELYNGDEREYALSDSELWQSEWGKGTIVRVAVNSRGEISAIEEAKTTGTIISSYDYAGKGYIYERRDGWGYFTTSKPSAGMDVGSMALIPIDKFKIIVYNKRSDEHYTGTVGDIVDYMSDPAHCTEIYITMNYENPKTMICIVDY